MARRLRLRTVLILVNLIVLALPLAGIQVLRLYESALVRQTESELIAQGVAVAAFYRATFERLTQHPQDTYSYDDAFLAEHSGPASEPPMQNAEPWQPRSAQLDLATSAIRPALPDPVPLNGPDPLALLVGETLNPVLQELQRVTLAGIRVVDFRGVIVASTADDGGLNLASGQEVQAALNGAGISTLRDRELLGEPPALESISRGSRIRVFVSTPIVVRERVLGAVLLSRTPANIFQALYGKRLLLLQALALLFLVVVGIAYLTSRTVVKPLRNLADAASRIAAGDRGALADVRPAGTAEIAQLGTSIHEMGDSLQRRADYLRDFARHLSHEFKTPLAAISGAVEILEDHGQEMDEAQRDRFLANVHADVERLNQLTERLLDLARAETGSPESHGASCSLDDVVERLSADHGVNWLGEMDSAQLAIDRASLEAVLGQLSDNARQHAGAEVDVALSAQRDGKFAELRFSDSGRGVSPSNRKRMFQPFFTTARDDGGTGLGLSIARALIESAGGSLELLDVSPGTTFRLKIPLARAHKRG